MPQDKGAPLRDGLSQQAAEPEVSALRASIPSARKPGNPPPIGAGGGGMIALAPFPGLAILLFLLWLA
jgi:hypothetical protein